MLQRGRVDPGILYDLSCMAYAIELVRNISGDALAIASPSIETMPLTNVSCTLRVGIYIT